MSKVMTLQEKVACTILEKGEPPDSGHRDVWLMVQWAGALNKAQVIIDMVQLEKGGSGVQAADLLEDPEDEVPHTQAEIAHMARYSLVGGWDKAHDGAPYGHCTECGKSRYMEDEEVFCQSGCRQRAKGAPETWQRQCWDCGAKLTTTAGRKFCPSGHVQPNGVDELTDFQEDKRAGMAELAGAWARANAVSQRFEGWNEAGWRAPYGKCTECGSARYINKDDLSVFCMSGCAQKGAPAPEPQAKLEDFMGDMVGQVKETLGGVNWTELGVIADRLFGGGRKR